jgi:hypothetical protein
VTATDPPAGIAVEWDVPACGTSDGVGSLLSDREAEDHADPIRPGERRGR